MLEPIPPRATLDPLATYAAELRRLRQTSLTDPLPTPVPIWVEVLVVTDDASTI